MDEFAASWKQADKWCDRDDAARPGLYNGYHSVDDVPDRSYGRGVKGHAICGHGMKGISSDNDKFGSFGSG